MKIARIAALALLVGALASTAIAKAPIDAFSSVPGVRAADLSPDGKRVAFLQRVGDTDTLVMLDLETHKAQALTGVANIKARAVKFLSPNYIVLLVSKTQATNDFSEQYEHYGAFAYNISTKSIVQLMRTSDYAFVDTNAGDIIGADADGKHVFMPAYYGTLSGVTVPTYEVMSVSLDTGRGVKSRNPVGETETIHWVLNAQGKAVAREDFDAKKSVHTIRAYDGDKPRIIFTENTPLRTAGIEGLSLDGKALILSTYHGSRFLSLQRLPLDGSPATGPIQQRKDADVEGVVMGVDQVVRGLVYAGMRPSYEMFDPALDADVKTAIAAAPDTSLHLDSWSADWSKLLFYASGGNRPERYMLFDRTTKKLTAIIDGREEIATSDIGEVNTIEYKARDGLKIPAILTWPAAVPRDKRLNLPMVVLPHGGPEAYDAAGFDWLAQFLANEGYLVLQPNFRGSVGFGGAFRNAGRRQWGRKMEDDIVDGAKLIAESGWADPKHICIMGWSYGGYAALAGGAMTPDLYKCVVSIAGPSDLREMLAYERSEYGLHSTHYNYWTTLIGDPDQDKDAIDAISPAHLAAQYKVPVLLIHGTQDTTVPPTQSDRMEAALRAAGKEVTYLKIPGDDHQLEIGSNRTKAFTAVSEFLAKYLKAPG